MSDPHSEPPASPAAPDQTASSSHAGLDAHAAGADEHGHGDTLGPIDWVAWGAGLAGLLVGLGTALAFVIATNRLG
jgi:hypothetical protein